MSKIFTFQGDQEIQTIVNDLKFRWSLESDASVIKKSLKDHHKEHFPGAYKAGKQEDK
jgi:hypothetical protein